jgi:beta-lactamase regulating signal transducer with metallopeptidase domain
MVELWSTWAGWWVRFAAAGGLLLLGGLLLMRLLRQPARRQRAGFWTITAALIVIPLSALPGWLPLPWAAPSGIPSLPVAAADSSLQRNIEARAPLPALVDQSEPADQQRWFAMLPDAGAPVPAPPVVTDVPSSPATPLPMQETPQSAPTSGPSSWQSARVWAVNGGLVLYAVIALALVTRLLLGHLVLIRLWKKSAPAPRQIADMLRSMSDDLPQQVALRVSERVAGPICFGIVRPRILLPATLVAQADEVTLHWVVAHELNHLSRRDPLAGWLVGLAQACYFFCPWFWSLRRQLRLSQEYLADAAAVGSRPEPGQSSSRSEEYAAFLIRSIITRAVPLSAAGVQAGTSDLYRRITMLLKRSGSMESRCPRRWSLLAGVGILSTAVVLGGMHLRAAAPDDTPKAEKKEANQPGATTGKEANPKAAAKSPEERRKELEAKIKDLDLNSPEFKEAVKELEKLIESVKPVPASRGPNFAPPPGFGLEPGNFPVPALDDADIQKMIEQMQKEQKEMMEQMFKRFGNRGPGLIQLEPLGGGGRRGWGLRGNDGRLGVRVEKPSPTLAEQLDLAADKGLVVADVVADSPAAKAGIKPHDILLEIGGKPVPSNPREFVQMINELKADQAVDFTVLRKGKKETIKGVKLPEARAAADDQPRFGPDGLPDARNFQPVPMPFPKLLNPLRLEAIKQPLELQNALDRGDSVRMTVQIVNDDFTIDSAQNGVEITVKGRKDGQEKKVSEVRIKDGDTKVKAESIDKVPEKYRDSVKKLLDSIK